LARLSREELQSLFVGYGYKPYFVEGSEPAQMHQLMAATLDTVIHEIQEIQQHARSKGDPTRPQWPMIILRTPKGWTGPKEVDGKKVEDFWRSHQVPLADLAKKTGAPQGSGGTGCAATKPEELFDENGRLLPELQELAPKGEKTHGGFAPRQRRPADAGAEKCRISVATPCLSPRPGTTEAEATRVLGQFLRGCDEAQPPQLPPLWPR
jgi:xylulose-5-phosphate/fructose-6-phosphate phosphoketolase